MIEYLLTAAAEAGQDAPAEAVEEHKVVRGRDLGAA